MHARIYESGKSAMQSGKANAGRWILEFEAEAARRIDPLMGWTSASDMRSNQVILSFETREAAIAFRVLTGRDPSPGAEERPAGEAVRLRAEELARQRSDTLAQVEGRALELVRGAGGQELCELGRNRCGQRAVLVRAERPQERARDHRQVVARLRARRWHAGRERHARAARRVHLAARRHGRRRHQRRRHGDPARAG